MQKRNRLLQGSMVLLVAVATGCASPAPVTPGPGAVAADAAAPRAGAGLIANNAGGLISNNAGGLISNNAGGLISNNAGGLISNNAGGLISNNAGGLISNNAGGLISNNAGGLTGAIRGPAAGLISNNAGGLISNNAGGLISNNAGGLISNNAGGLISNNAGGLISNNAGGLISNNAGGLISNNAGGYKLAQAAESGNNAGLTEPVAGAKVAVFNERGEMVSYNWVTTDDDGNYIFTKLKASGPLLFIKAVYEREGQQIVLMSTAPAPRNKGLVNVSITPATTLVAKKFNEMIRLKAVNPNTLKVSTASKIATVLAPTLNAAGIVAAAIATNKQASATFDAVVAEATVDVPTAAATIQAVAAAAGNATVVAETPAAEAKEPVADIPAVVNAPSGGGGSSAVVVAAPPANETPTPEAPETQQAGEQPAEAPPASTLTATVKTVASLRDGKHLEGNGTSLFAPSASGNQAVSVTSLTANAALSDTGESSSAMTFDGGVRYALSNGQITWAGGVVTLTGLDASLLQDFAVHAGKAYLTSKANAIYEVDLGAGTTTVLAGEPGGFGDYVEGAGTNARFNNPSGIIAAPEGLYVADSFNQRVRKLTYAGVSSLVAGSSLGGRDGAGGNAQFSSPQDLTRDAAGNLYVVESAGGRVRKIDVDGNVSLVSGGMNGSVDGVADAVGFRFPSSISLIKVNGADVLVVGEFSGALRLISGY